MEKRHDVGWFGRIRQSVRAEIPQEDIFQKYFAPGFGPPGSSQVDEGGNDSKYGVVIYGRTSIGRRRKLAKLIKTAERCGFEVVTVEYGTADEICAKGFPTRTMDDPLSRHVVAAMFRRLDTSS